MMKALWLCTWFPNRVEPKNGNFIARHAKCVESFAQIDVLQVQGDSSLKPWHYEVENRKVSGYNVTVVYYGVSWFLRPVQIFLAYFRGLNRIRKNSPLSSYTHIHVHVIIHAGIVGALVAWWYGKPLLVSEHSSAYSLDKEKSWPNVFYWLSKQVGKRADLIMPVSRSLREGMKWYGVKGHYKVVPNVVDENVFHPEINKRRDVVTFLHVSSFQMEAKNVEGILEAVAALEKKGQGFQFIIAGDGDFERLKNHAADLQISRKVLRFRGPLSEFEVAELMKECHCFVLFSNYENLPCVLIEAAACGMFIIATNVGGVSEVIEGDLLPPGDVNALVEAMERCLDREVEKTEGYSSVSNFYVSRVTTDLLNVYEQFNGK